MQATNSRYINKRDKATKEEGSTDSKHQISNYENDLLSSISFICQKGAIILPLAQVFQFVVHWFVRRQQLRQVDLPGA